MAVVEKFEDQLQKQLDQLSVSDAKQTNLVLHDLKPRQCMGKCSIELGDITQHNIMVTFIVEFLKLFNF
jgi:hypothetical protein